MSEINLISHLDEIYWRRKFVELEQDLVIAQALADKRLELLKEIEPHLTTCPVCLKGMVNQRIHTDDCELAEAIAEE